MVDTEKLNLLLDHLLDKIDRCIIEKEKLSTQKLLTTILDGYDTVDIVVLDLMEKIY